MNTVIPHSVITEGNDAQDANYLSVASFILRLDIRMFSGSTLRIPLRDGYMVIRVHTHSLENFCGRNHSVKWH